MTVVSNRQNSNIKIQQKNKQKADVEILYGSTQRSTKMSAQM